MYQKNLKVFNHEYTFSIGLRSIKGYTQYTFRLQDHVTVQYVQCPISAILYTMFSLLWRQRLILRTQEWTTSPTSERGRVNAAREDENQERSGAEPGENLSCLCAHSHLNCQSVKTSTGTTSALTKADILLVSVGQTQTVNTLIQIFF